MLDQAGREPRPFTEFHVIRALTSFGDRLDTRSGSIMFLVGSRSTPRDPFHFAFLGRVEDRGELIRRLQLIEPRERLLLFLWYVAGWPVASIAERLGISRVHCYRLRASALRRMTADVRGDGAEDGDAASAVAPQA